MLIEIYIGVMIVFVLFGVFAGSILSGIGDSLEKSTKSNKENKESDE